MTRSESGETVDVTQERAKLLAEQARAVVRFLRGEGSIDDFWFGERPASKPAFWWRKHLGILDLALDQLATLTPTMEAAPVERGLREALQAAKAWLDYDNSPMGPTEEAAYWRLMEKINAALSSPPEGPDKEGV